MSVAKRLRQKLLDLAIHGKLVPQCAKDEPAGELLARIRKARNAGGGRTRTSAAPLPIPEEEIPFDLPRGWVWCRLGELVSIISGVSYQKGDVCANGVRILRGGNIKEDNRLYLREDDVFLPPKYASEENSICRGDVVIVASTGSASVIGRPAVADDSMLNVQIGAFLRIIRAVDSSVCGWVHVLFRSNFYRAHIREKSKGTNIKNLKNEYLSEFTVPLPPLAEQTRIVEKLNEMLKEATRVAECTERLARLRKKARAKILDLAIRGKLVKQEKTDEPAAALLERIAAEKAKLVAEKKIKKEKPLPPIAEGEIPFDLPKGWAWARIGDISSGFMYGTAEKSQPSGAVPVLRMGNLQDGEIDFGDLVYTSNKEDIKTYALTPGDLLFNRTNSDEKVGKVSIFRDDRPCIYAGYLVRFRPLLCDSEYINYVMNSHYQWTFCQSVKSDAVNQSNISASKFVKFPVPIPPLAEQRRIVAKVKEMLAACDALGGEG